ncbi:gliding motility protein GldM [Ornithobacterium rhinotracheale]|uniref:type IX secretion system motor protein PorM/GldM n=1 Tax=Ornithobacterium rhinotracheale TaxID=28251 RepID=UPI00129C5172|nr:gliding motility protein GldM [Ornithobacterium rhinotracheale]MRI63096.1 gliding motility protein GldM [Ornithobacterium rhinotracheale]
MAKGKLPPRQKMINLMYLIFIAMLAMQIGREVLRSFEGVNTSLTDATALASENNNTFYDQIKNKAKDDSDYQKVQVKAEEVKAKSNEVFQAIEAVKQKLITETGYKAPKDGEETSYNSLQNTDAVTNLFFRAQEPSETGAELKNKINQYHDFMLSQYTSDRDKSRVNQLFSTEGEAKKEWLYKMFYNQPMVAALTNLSKIQSDVRTEEGNLVRNLLSDKLEDEIQLKAFQPIVDIPPIVKKGDKVLANIAFGAYDNTLQGSVTANGRQIALSNGRATFDLNTSTDGTQTIRGTMSYRKPDGSTETMPFERSYQVVSETLARAPKGGSISADKMNVVYRGVTNPITATINGADGPINMTASTGSLSGSNGKYNYRVSSGNTVVFTASAKTSSGAVVTEKKEFRIKPVPPPQGQIRGKNSLTTSVSSLPRLTVEAAIPNFEFPVSFTVKSFKVKVPGQKTISVSGNSMSGAERVLRNVKSGDAVNIFDIEATASGIDGRVPNISPVVIDVQ